MSTSRPSLWRVLSETSRIINAHSSHFFALSVLFVFPASIVATIYTYLLQPASLHSHYHRFLSSVSTPDSEIPNAGESQLPFQLLLYLFSFILNISAVSSITYTAFNAFFNRPVKLSSSLKSILVSFFPMLATKLVNIITIGLIFFSFGMLILILYIVPVLLGINVEYKSIYSIVFLIATLALFMGVVFKLAVEWCLSPVIVVVESQWGYAPLKRSSYLVKGMRGVVFSMILFFAILSMLLALWYTRFMANFADKAYEGQLCWLVVQMAVFAVFSTILSLYGVVAQTVVFVYCKALHGELAFQINEKLGVEYGPLPTDVV